MKRITFLILSLALISCSSNSDPNDPDPVLYLSPANTDLSINSDQKISLLLENIKTPIFGLSLQIEYDDSIISFSDATGFSVNDFFDQNVVSFAKNIGSTIHLSLSQIQGSNSKSGSGTICSFSFSADNSGSASINIILSELKFYNSFGEEITIPNLVVSQALINVQ